MIRLFDESANAARRAERPPQAASLPHSKSVFICVHLWLFAALALQAAEPADAIWTARYVVTMDAQHRVIEHGAVAVRGNRILAVGPQAAIDKQYTTAHRLDRPQAVLIPGLIDTHTHAAMSLFRGIADDLTLQDWLEHYIFPAEARNVTPDFVTWGTRLACLEMMLSGTTTFTDMYYFEDRVAEATKAAGMRGVLGETIIGFPVPDAKTPADSLAWTEKYIQRYRNDALITPAVAPHALYTNSAETLRASRALANKYGVPLVIHVAETRKEREDCLKANNATPVAYLNSLGEFDGRTVAAHCVWLNEADMAIVREKNVGVAHCPSSNMKLASGVAPITRMLALGIHVGLGPDGPAGSNNDFDLMEEMNLAADLAKVTTGDPRSVNAEQALEMATMGGARVIGRERDLGSLEAGKLADMVAVRLDRPHAVPLYNIYSQLVYALKGSDVRDVMVNGRAIVSDGRSLTLDAALILQKAREYRRRVQESLHTPREVSH